MAKTKKMVEEDAHAALAPHQGVINPNAPQPAPAVEPVKEEEKVAKKWRLLRGTHQDENGVVHKVGDVFDTVADLRALDPTIQKFILVEDEGLRRSTAAKIQKHKDAIAELEAQG